MRIEWKIAKKRGNLRPVLSYAVYLEEHEKALALPEVSIVSSIPKPEEDRQNYCYPGLFERTAEYSPAAFYMLEAPSHRGHSWTRSLMLPWRENNQYPEVEASFRQLREAMETEIANACASLPMQLTGATETSTRAKAVQAPGLMAERFLRLAAGASAAR